MVEIQGASIHINGIVQGVGFRPFVYALAKRFGLTGWVRNTSAGVDIELDGVRELLEDFVFGLKTETPPLARIDDLQVVWRSKNGFTSFEIVHSEAISGAFQPISPDVCICPDCLRELFDRGDRRYRYPFINCTNCGPRFTIIKDIPYDRHLTTMAPFAMCPDCAVEYADPLDRRFHAQPVACPVCGPKIWLELSRGKTIISEGDSALKQVRQLLMSGKIVAVKGLGGFHLACDATNAGAVIELRRRKLRVDKPFALMMYDIETVEKHCFLDAYEQSLLESSARPVVLLRRKPGSPIVPDVAPRQDTLGVMLPYTPLHFLLLEKAVGFPEALVMTSGNLSEEPIATSNDEACRRLANLADAFLLHDRDIYTRCDDSVVRSFGKNVHPIRRSRGYAPFPVRLPKEVPPILATGGELKNTFCITHGNYAFLSHHIGDMENYDTLRSFEQGVEHFERLFRVKPEALAYDLHPNYMTTRYALARAGRENLPVIGVQHHHAHIASCMADHGLDGSRPLIGIAFDGTGYGLDGAIWGGEFIVADYLGFQRPYHLAYFPLPGGDAAIIRPGRTALALLWMLGIDWDDCLAPVKDLSSEERMTLHVQLERKLNSPLTSSMGRLFDAAASLADVRQKVNYEAQAAIEFEALVDTQETGAYHFEIAQSEIQVLPAVTGLVADVLAGVPAPVISARFHHGLVNMIREVCSRIRAQTGLNEIALSGGVWQNMTLLTLSLAGLRQDGFQVYIHHQVPTNDGGLALGQALVAAHKMIGQEVYYVSRHSR